MDAGVACQAVYRLYNLEDISRNTRSYNDSSYSILKYCSDCEHPQQSLRIVNVGKERRKLGSHIALGLIIFLRVLS